jgi:hypothetical protein
LCFSVDPRVSTLRFWRTMASASEQSTSVAGMPFFTRLTMSVSAKTPHLAATWWSLVSSKWICTTSAGGSPTLSMHLSMVAPVPDAHLSFIDGAAVLSPVLASLLKMMIFASCPPSSITLPTSGWRFSTARVTALTSCTNLAPSGAHSGAAPEPVMKTRHSARGESGKAASITSSSSSTFSGCLVWWRW